MWKELFWGKSTPATVLPLPVKPPPFLPTVPPFVARDTLCAWQEKNHPWLELSDVHRETTENIRVTVIPFYMGMRVSLCCSVRSAICFTGMFFVRPVCCLKVLTGEVTFNHSCNFVLMGINMKLFCHIFLENIGFCWLSVGWEITCNVLHNSASKIFRKACELVLLLPQSREVALGPSAL